MTMRNAISAWMAFCVICDPQLAPMKLMLILSVGTPRSRLSTSCTWVCWA